MKLGSKKINIRKIIFAILVVFVLIFAGYFIFKDEPEANNNVTATQSSNDNNKVSSAGSKAPTSTEAWAIRCDEKGDGYCEIFQRLVSKENNQRVIEFAIGYPDKEKDAQVVIILPFGILLTEGVSVKIDDTQLGKLPVRTCTEAGCILLTAMDKDVVNKLISAKSLTIGFADMQSKPVNLSLSLDGFANKLKEIK